MSNQSSNSNSDISKKLLRRRKILKGLRSAWLVFQVLLVLMIMGALFAGGVAAGYFASHVKDEPLRDYKELNEKIHSIHQTGEAYFRDGRLIGEIRAESYLYPVELDDVSSHLIDAVLATEDNEFFEHEGIDLRGLSRAVLQEITTPGQGSGGSTLTQQLVKMQILTPERTFERKFREIVLAMRLEKMFKKQTILEAYLNMVYFGFNADGSNIEGVQAAAEGIFDTDVGDLNIAQSAYLAGMIQSPGRYTPFTRKGTVNEENLERGQKRAQYVLKRMLETGRISQEEYEEALAFDYKASLAKPKPSMVEKYPYLTFSIEERAAEILADQMLEEEGRKRDDLSDEELESLLDSARRELSIGGYKVYTTIDEDLYNAFHEVAANYDFGPRSRNKTYTYEDPETGETKEIGYLEQAAATLIDHETGAILAKLEGRDFEESEIDFTTRPFQPGSSIKPVLDYATAFDIGALQPASVIDDVPIFNWDSTKEYPTNFDNRFRGLMTVREALTRSQNIPAIKAFRTAKASIGEEGVYEYVHKLGLSHFTLEEMQHDANAIGGASFGWTVEEATAAMAAFANKGQYHEPYMIEKIETLDGDIVYEHKAVPEQVFSEETAFLITDILRDVVNQSYGTAHRIRQGMGQGLDIAGKTGTTDDQNDYWFVGYTPQVSLGLWMGFEQRDRLAEDYQSRNQYLWVELMKKVQELTPEYANTDLTFEQPENIVRRTVCSKSGKLPSKLCQEAGYLVTDYFNPNFVPTETDDSVIRARVIIVDGKRYLAHDSTPDDFIEEGDIFVKREPLNIPAHLQSIRAQLLPADWDESAPQERDPREDNGKDPDVPGNVRINGSVITWDPVSDNDIAGYRIYRGDRDGHFTHVASIADHQDKQYEDPESANYVYVVTAVDIAGRESERSELAYAGEGDIESFFDPEAPLPPQGLQAEDTGSEIRLSWQGNADEDAVQHYLIYVSTGEDFQQLGQTSSTTYTYQPDGAQTIEFYVTAVNNGGESEPSATVKVSRSAEESAENEGNGTPDPEEDAENNNENQSSEDSE